MSSEESPMDLFRQFLIEKMWPWTEQDQSTLSGSISGEAGFWGWMCCLPQNGDFLPCHSTVPVNVPPQRRTDAMEYLTRANWGLTLATFEIDLSDGQVHSRTSVPAHGLTTAAIEHLMLGNFRVMDRYLPGLMAVIFGKTSPRKAIEKAEADFAGRSPTQPEAESKGEQPRELPSPAVNGNGTIPPVRSPASRRRRLFRGNN